eukprot:322929-Pelagomonas_calceolata.AAC.1
MAASSALPMARVNRRLKGVVIVNSAPTHTSHLSKMMCKVTFMFLFEFLKLLVWRLSGQTKHQGGLGARQRSQYNGESLARDSSVPMFSGTSLPQSLTLDTLLVFTGASGGIYWARGGGGREKESPG